MFSEKFISYTLPYITIIGFIIAIIYLLIIKKQLRQKSLDVGAKMGFMPFNEDSNFMMRKEMQNMDILLNLFWWGPYNGRPGGTGVEVGCRVANTSCKTLCIYRQSSIGANRPPGFLPPEIKNVEKWEWYVVRGEPEEIIRKTLFEINDDDEKLFREKDLLSGMKLVDNKLVFTFKFISEDSKKASIEQITEVVRVSVALASKINAV